MQKELQDYLCLALDNPGSLGNAARHLVDLEGKVGVVKFNSGFVEQHQPLVRMATDLGYDVWVDLKTHDIPPTVESTVKVLGYLGVAYATIHISGGTEMMKAAVKASSDVHSDMCKSSNAPPRLKILGITVLTSINQETFNTELRIPGTIEEHVLHLTGLAKIAGLDGVVCSPLEVRAVKELIGDGMMAITPGVRFADAAADDQQRIATPQETTELGSDLLVMGRPLVKGGVIAAERALAEVKAGLSVR